MKAATPTTIADRRAAVIEQLNEVAAKYRSEPLVAALIRDTQRIVRHSKRPEAVLGALSTLDDLVHVRRRVFAAHMRYHMEAARHVQPVEHQAELLESRLAIERRLGASAEELAALRSELAGLAATIERIEREEPELIEAREAAFACEEEWRERVERFEAMVRALLRALLRINEVTL